MTEIEIGFSDSGVFYLLLSDIDGKLIVIWMKQINQQPNLV
ncbi:MAG: hypothetical protein WC451_02215 [Patescibacteria group bacterium]|jgi:hypothetical protein